MERRIPLAVLAAVCMLALYAQELPQRENIQLMLWADLDAYPEAAAAERTAHPDDSVLDYPVRRLKELAPYLITGMVYGWEFSYTPSDKMRGVAEYFDCTPLHELGGQIKNIRYKKPWVENNRLYCWIEYPRTPDMLQSFYYWQSIVHPRIQGAGNGSIFDGFDGVQTACREALKNAVRTYYRNEIKNKPKVITGKVLINGVPRLAVDAGRYVVELDFFLETGTIIKYTQF